MLITLMPTQRFHITKDSAGAMEKFSLGDVVNLKVSISSTLYLFPMNHVLTVRNEWVI